MTEDARQLFDQGKLDEAIAASLGEVKKNPSDARHRSFLCTLLCFNGDFDRADRHLNTIAQQNPSSEAAIGVWRGLLRGETARQQFYEEGRVPEFLAEPSPREQAAMKATIELREGKFDSAEALLQAPISPIAGEAEDQNNVWTFDSFRDWDDVTASTLEVISAKGKFYWIPLTAIEHIEFDPLQGPRDLIWRPAKMTLLGGPQQGQVYLPTLYPGSHAHEDAEIRLARVTDWKDQGNITRGVGVRMFMIGDENKQILELKGWKFEPSA